MLLVNVAGESQNTMYQSNCALCKKIRDIGPCILSRSGNYGFLYVMWQQSLTSLDRLFDVPNQQSGFQLYYELKNAQLQYTSKGLKSSSRAYPIKDH